MVNDRYDEGLDLLLELTVLLNEDMTHALADIGLTTSRTHLLWVLHHRGASTQKELADALGVSARNVTGLVDALVDTGFVTREPHPTDRRASLVTPTEHARTTTIELERQQHELAHQLFADMPTRRYESLLKGLRDVRDRIHDLIAQGGAP